MREEARDACLVHVSPCIGHVTAHVSCVLLPDLSGALVRMPLWAGRRYALTIGSTLWTIHHSAVLSRGHFHFMFYCSSQYCKFQEIFGRDSYIDFYIKDHR